MKNIGPKIEKIYEINQITQKNQIKDKLQLNELEKSIEFCNKNLMNQREITRKKEEKTND